MNNRKKEYKTLYEYNREPIDTLNTNGNNYELSKWCY